MTLPHNAAGDSSKVKNRTTDMKAFFLNRLSSTNSYLADQMKAGKLEGECYVVVDYQDKGRGQCENTWHSRKGYNLLMSVLLFPAFLSASRQFRLSMAASLAVCSSLNENLDLKIKWPNDILAGDRKIGGILIENSIMDKKLSHSIVGLGLNVNQLDFPDFPRKATSLYLECGHPFNVKELAHGYATILDQYIFRLKAGESADIEQEYLDRLYLRDYPSDFETREGIFRGIIRGVSPLGELLVEKKGRTETYSFREIRFLK